MTSSTLRHCVFVCAGSFVSSALAPHTSTTPSDEVKIHISEAFRRHFRTPLHPEGLDDLQSGPFVARRIPVQYTHDIDPASDGIRRRLWASCQPRFVEVLFDSGCRFTCQQPTDVYHLEWRRGKGEVGDLRLSFALPVAFIPCSRNRSHLYSSCLGSFFILLGAPVVLMYTCRCNSVPFGGPIDGYFETARFCEIHDMSGSDRYHAPIDYRQWPLNRVGRCTFLVFLTSRCCVS